MEFYILKSDSQKLWNEYEHIFVIKIKWKKSNIISFKINFFWNPFLI